MKKFVTSLGAVLLAVGMASPAFAYTQFNITFVDGDWSNAVADPASGTISIANDQDYAVVNDQRLSTARWGTSTGYGQSGYDFVSDATPFTVSSDGSAFAFGTFTHQNWPITGTSLDSINLDLAGSIETMGGTPIGTITTTALINHNETPNSYGDYRDNDIVTITNPIVNASWSDGVNTYYFNMIGFSTNGGTTITPGWDTVEGQSNSAVLYGKITEFPVPEPGTLTLMGVGLALAGAIRSKRKFSEA